MTLYEFNQLPLDEACQYIWYNGTYLATRSEGAYRINLYYLKEFYGEVWYKQIDNTIKKVNSFRSKEALEPYIDLIELDI
jgi:hypothetical protein